MTQTSLVPVLGKMHDEIDRVFNRFFGNGGPEPFFRPMVFEAMEGTYLPPLDLTETATEYVVKLEVPGVPKENVEVQLNGDVLTIRGHREEKVEKKGESYLLQEQKSGKFIRTLRLPASVVPGKVDAKYESGMLLVKLPKLAPAPVSKIEVK